MSLSYAECVALVEELQPWVGSRLVAVSSWGKGRWIFSIGSYHLLLVLQAPFVRFHEIRNPPRARKPVNLPKIVGRKTEAISLVNEDRILELSLEGGNRVICELFPKSANLLVLSGEEILYSWQEVDATHYIAPIRAKVPDQTTVVTSSEEIARRYYLLEKEEEKEALRRDIERKLKRKIKGVERQIAKAKVEEVNAHQWEEVQHQGELLQGHFSQLCRGLEEVWLPDWKSGEERLIPLDPALLPKENIDLFFKRARKMRRSLEHLAEQQRAAEGRMERYRDLLGKLPELEDKRELERFQKKHGLEQQAAPPAQRKGSNERLSYREYMSASGLSILVGKSARDNDKLTFQVANGNDWWLHVVGVPGSHVVIKTDHGKEPDHEALLDAGQLALHYSKAKQAGSGEVHVTQRKFLTRASKKEPGKVLLSRHRTLHVELDPQRFRALKERGRN